MLVISLLHSLVVSLFGSYRPNSKVPFLASESLALLELVDFKRSPILLVSRLVALIFLNDDDDRGRWNGPMQEHSLFFEFVFITEFIASNVVLPSVGVCCLYRICRFDEENSGYRFRFGSPEFCFVTFDGS